MLPEIETFRKPVFGAAITWDGAKAPTLAAPFPKMEIVAVFALDARTVLFVVRRPHGGDSLSLAVYDLTIARIVRRSELVDAWYAVPFMSEDRRTLFAYDANGIRVVDVATLGVARRLELFRDDVDGGALTTYDALDGLGPLGRTSDASRYRLAREAGWRDLTVLTFVRASTSHEVSERDADHLLVTGRPGRFVGVDGAATRWDVAVIGWRDGTAATVAQHDMLNPTALDRIDPRARMVHVSRKHLGVYLASPPTKASEAGLFACEDHSEHALVLHLWRLGQIGAEPFTVLARTAGIEVWAAAAAAPPRVQRRPGEPEPADIAERVRVPSPDGEIADPDLWRTAAGNLLGAVYEDPRDGLLWLSFTDGCLRSLDDGGRLGPLIRLAGEANVVPNVMLLGRHWPTVTFQGADGIVVEKQLDWRMASYAFRASDMAGRTGPVTLMPAKPGPLPGSHAKAFAAFIRDRRRDRFVLSDWSREGVAAALEAQRGAVAAGLDDLVDDEAKLTFRYSVAGKPVTEAAFFGRIARDALPVAPELRALLLAYTEALGAGGEGMQPWQDPDEGVGGLGPALLDPDCHDVLRAYLETRDGEHEGYALDDVVPAFFKSHGWRDAAAVRFAIYATLNRYWGGRKPAEGFKGMRRAMARLLTPDDAAAAILQEAAHFGRKGDFGYDAAAYRAAFRSLLDPAVPFEAAVRGLLEDAVTRSAPP